MSRRNKRRVNAVPRPQHRRQPQVPVCGVHARSVTARPAAVLDACSVRSWRARAWRRAAEHSCKTSRPVLVMLAVMTTSTPVTGHGPDGPRQREQSGQLSDGGFHVVENGSPAAHALLLLNNAAAPPAIWDPVVPALAARFRVIRVGLRGGQTAAGPAGGYAVAAQARRLAAVLDHIGVSRVTLVGHSSGCIMATALAEQRPDAVAALALVSMGPDLDAKLPDSPLFWLLRSRIAGRLLWLARTQASMRRAARSGMARPVDIPDVFVTHLRQLTYREFAGTMRASGDYLCRQSLPERLSGLGLPLLVIFGADDGRWCSASATAYRAVPGARIELLPGIGHTPMLEEPETAGRLLRDFAAATAPAS